VPPIKIALAGCLGSDMFREFSLFGRLAYVSKGFHSICWNGLFRCCKGGEDRYLAQADKSQPESHDLTYWQTDFANHKPYQGG
jgi:hypothetical protein